MLSKYSKFNKLVESITWIVVVAIIFGVRFLPQNPIDNTMTYVLVGGISAFALLYYLIIYKYFSKSNRMYLKSMADIILIGVLINLLKDYGQFLFALYFLPLAAAALSLEFINALLIATIATLFVVSDIFLGSYNLLPQASPVLQGAWQIGMILFMTIFCRFMALEIKEEQSKRVEFTARRKALEEETHKEREFIMLAAHQLYTPLSIIRGYSSMLENKSLGQLSPKQSKASAAIYSNIKRMSALVTELLSIFKIQYGKYEIKLKSTDINQLLRDIVGDYNQTKLKNKITLRFEPSNIHQISIDQDKIRGVVCNLIDNAIKYTEEGDIIVSAKQNQIETIISIDDEGKGIREEDREKMFEPFFRGKNILELDNQGTGLGLYICKLIIFQHGGKIWYEDKKKGTIFKFSLPNSMEE